MPRLRDLLTQVELDLLRLVPTLPVPLDDFLEAEFLARITVDRLLYNLFSQIPGAKVTPTRKDKHEVYEGYVSAYADYQGWLAWFVARRAPSMARRGGDIDLQRALTQAQLDRAGTANLPQGITRPHVWAEWQTPPQEGRKRAPRQRRRAQEAQAEKVPTVTQERGIRGVTEEFTPRGQRSAQPRKSELWEYPSVDSAARKLQARIESMRRRGGPNPLGNV